MARAGTYNIKAIATRIAKSAKFRRATLKNAEKKYAIEKKKLLERFQNHSITREIEGGADASNSSNTLGGRGNLFSYIGFNRSSNPIAPVEKVLLTSGGIKKRGVKTKIRKSKIRQTYTATAPDVNLLKSASPMPFQGGRSWLFDIETGISGFNNYLVKRFSAGRSGTALQTKNRVRGGSYRPPSNGYVRKMLAQFIASFK